MKLFMVALIASYPVAAAAEIRRHAWAATSPPT
jgi:hypothetical protein